MNDVQGRTVSHLLQVVSTLWADILTRVLEELEGLLRTPASSWGTGGTAQAEGHSAALTHS